MISSSEVCYSSNEWYCLYHIIVADWLMIDNSGRKIMIGHFWNAHFLFPPKSPDSGQEAVVFISASMFMLYVYVCVFSLLVLLNSSFSRSVDWYKGSLMPGRKMTEYSELCIGLTYRRCIVLDLMTVCYWSWLIFARSTCNVEKFVAHKQLEQHSEKSSNHILPPWRGS